MSWWNPWMRDSAASGGEPSTPFSPLDLNALYGGWIAEGSQLEDSRGDPVGNGGIIDKWLDAGPGSNHLTESSAGKPTWVEFDPVFGNEPSVSFDGIAQVIGTPAHGGISQPYTMYGVAFVEDTVKTISEMWTTGSSRNSMAIRVGNWEGRPNLVGPAASTGAHYFATIFNGVSSELWVDGIQVATVGDTTAVWTNINIGARDLAASASASFQGRIPLVVHQAAIATAQEISDMNAWMANRYGL